MSDIYTDKKLFIRYSTDYQSSLVNNKNLVDSIYNCYKDQIQRKVVFRYLFDYYEANKDKYRDKDIDYEEFRDNSSFGSSSVNVYDFDDNTVRADFLLVIVPYLSDNKRRLFPLSVGAIFDKDTCEFVRFEYSPPDVIYRDDFVLKKED